MFVFIFAGVSNFLFSYEKWTITGYIALNMTVMVTLQQCGVYSGANTRRYHVMRVFRNLACAYTRSENVNLLNVQLCNIEIYCIDKAYMLLISERKPKMVNVC